MSRTYWSDPHPRPAPGWVVPLILSFAASVGYAIARIIWHITTEGKP